MKKLLTTALLMHIFLAASAQQTPERNDLYLEAFGAGLFGSLNYERQLTRQPGLGIRFGMGFYTENAFYLTTTAGINYLFPLKKGNSFIDAGVNLTRANINGRLFKSSNTNGESYFNFIPSIGYRKHTAKDLMWRISLTPVANKFAFTPWLGFALGKRF